VCGYGVVINIEIKRDFRAKIIKSSIATIMAFVVLSFTIHCARAVWLLKREA
jgi:hypothetical protein